MAATTESKAKKPEQMIYEWWEHYSSESEQGEASRKGEFANLRRCKNLEEILFTPQYQYLYRKVNKAKWVNGSACNNKEAIALLAGVLAYIKEDVKSEKNEKKHVAEHFARVQEGGDKPIVSEARFMRLMKIKTHTELFTEIVRIIRLAGDSAPLNDLITSLYWWNDKTRQKWTFEYFDKVPESK